jgi:predicted transcriptional regulator
MYEETRRGKLEIMGDILRVALNGARKTEIVYRANLNFTRIERYIPLLEKRGLIEIARPLYKTTEKGEEFLRSYQELRQGLTGF